jgi:hypothetical protein
VVYNGAKDLQKERVTCGLPNECRPISVTAGVTVGEAVPQLRRCHLLLTSADRFPAQVTEYGICGGLSGIGGGFLGVLWFPAPNMPQMAPESLLSSIIPAGRVGQLLPLVRADWDRLHHKNNWYEKKWMTIFNPWPLVCERTIPTE